MKDFLTESKELGKRAVEEKKIPSFAVVYSSQGITFYIPDEDRSKPLTTEQAHSQFKNLLGIP